MKHQHRLLYLSALMLLLACNKHGRPQNRYSEPAFRFESFSGQATAPLHTGAAKPETASEPLTKPAFKAQSRLAGAQPASGKNKQAAAMVSTAAQSSLKAPSPDAGKGRQTERYVNKDADRETLSDNACLIGACGLTALLSGLSFAAYSRRSAISLWAAKHKTSARAALIGGQGAMLLSMYGLGQSLGMDVPGLEGMGDGSPSMDGFADTALLGLSTAALLLYPVKRIKTGLLAFTQRKQKLFSALMLGFGAASMLNAGANGAIQLPSSGDFTVGNIFLTLLAIAGFLFMGYLLVALTCTLACEGLILLSYLVGFGGGILLVYLLILALKSIWSNRVRSVPMETQIRGKG